MPHGARYLDVRPGRAIAFIPQEFRRRPDSVRGRAACLLPASLVLTVSIAGAVDTGEGRQCGTVPQAEVVAVDGHATVLHGAAPGRSAEVCGGHEDCGVGVEVRL